MANAAESIEEEPVRQDEQDEEQQEEEEEIGGDWQQAADEEPQDAADEEPQEAADEELQEAADEEPQEAAEEKLVDDADGAWQGSSDADPQPPKKRTRRGRRRGGAGGAGVEAEANVGGEGAGDLNFSVQLSNVPTDYSHDTLVELHEALGLDVSKFQSTKFMKPGKRNAEGTTSVMMRYADQQAAQAAAEAIQGQPVTGLDGEVRGLEAEVKTSPRLGGVYPSVYITDVPDEYTEHMVYELHKDLDPSFTDTLVSVKLLASKDPSGETRCCIARYRDEAAAELAISGLRGKRLQTKSGASKFLGLRMAKPAEWMVNTGSGAAGGGASQANAAPNSAGRQWGQGKKHRQQEVPCGVPLQGVVRIWKEANGFGFLSVGGGPDIFIHRKNLLDGNILVVGAPVTFEAVWDAERKRYFAVLLRGASGDKAEGGGGGNPPPPPPPTAPPELPANELVHGRVKKWAEDRGFGFLVWASAGSPVFVHRKTLLDQSLLEAGGEVIFEAVWDGLKGNYVATTCTPVLSREPSEELVGFAELHGINDTTRTWLAHLPAEILDTVVGTFDPDSEEDAAQDINARVRAFTKTLLPENGVLKNTLQHSGAAHHEGGPAGPSAQVPAPPPTAANYGTGTGDTQWLPAGELVPCRVKHWSIDRGFGFLVAIPSGQKVFLDRPSLTPPFEPELDGVVTVMAEWDATFGNWGQYRAKVCYEGNHTDKDVGGEDGEASAAKPEDDDLERGDGNDDGDLPADPSEELVVFAGEWDLDLPTVEWLCSLPHAAQKRIIADFVAKHGRDPELFSGNIGETLQGIKDVVLSKLKNVKKAATKLGSASSSSGLAAPPGGGRGAGSKRLLLTRLPTKATEDMVKELLCLQGDVEECNILSETADDCSATVSMAEAKQAAAVLKAAAAAELHVGGMTTPPTVRHLTGDFPSNASNNLFVVGLPAEGTQEFIENVFAQIGTVRQIKVIGKGALIRMNNTEAASIAIDCLDGRVLQDGIEAPVSVRYAENRAESARDADIAARRARQAKEFEAMMGQGHSMGSLPPPPPPGFFGPRCSVPPPPPPGVWTQPMGMPMPPAPGPLGVVPPRPGCPPLPGTTLPPPTFARPPPGTGPPPPPPAGLPPASTVIKAVLESGDPINVQMGTALADLGQALVNPSQQVDEKLGVVLEMMNQNAGLPPPPPPPSGLPPPKVPLPRPAPTPLGARPTARPSSKFNGASGAAVPSRPSSSKLQPLSGVARPPPSKPSMAASVARARPGTAPSSWRDRPQAEDGADNGEAEDEDDYDDGSAGSSKAADGPRPPPGPPPGVLTMALKPTSKALPGPKPSALKKQGPSSSSLRPGAAPKARYQEAHQFWEDEECEEEAPMEVDDDGEAASWGVGSADVAGEGQEEEWGADGAADSQWLVEGNEVVQEEEEGEEYVAPWRQPRQLQQQQEDAEAEEEWDEGGGSEQKPAGQKRKRTRTRKKKNAYDQW